MTEAVPERDGWPLDPDLSPADIDQLFLKAGNGGTRRPTALSLSKFACLLGAPEPSDVEREAMTALLADLEAADRAFNEILPIKCSIREISTEDLLREDGPYLPLAELVTGFIVAWMRSRPIGEYSVHAATSVSEQLLAMHGFPVSLTYGVPIKSAIIRWARKIAEGKDVDRARDSLRRAILGRIRRGLDDEVNSRVNGHSD